MDEMCRDSECDQRYGCYRYRAIPVPGQRYVVFKVEDYRCGFFHPVNGKELVNGVCGVGEVDRYHFEESKHREWVEDGT